MLTRLASVLVGLIATLSAACAQDFRVEDVPSPRSLDVAQLKADTVAFSDQVGGADADKSLLPFDDWARKHPVEKKYLALFPAYIEPRVVKNAASSSKTDTKSDAKGDAEPVTEKLYMYVARARFLLDRPPAAIDLSRYVTLPFLEEIDPAIKHKAIAPSDLPPFTDVQGTGNENPDRKWCTERTNLMCIRSSYGLEGKIPLGILLANKLRDSSKKISDHIEFDSELSQISAADLDQAGLKELTKLDTPATGVLEQNIFYVNQIMKFGKFFAVFQDHPTDAGKTVVTAFMALAIDGGVFDKKREFENVPVLRNLVPEQVLLGRSSFNSGESISAGLPKYARNEIRRIAGILAHDK
jgi:hypothetical protein